MVLVIITKKKYLLNLWCYCHFFCPVSYLFFEHCIAHFCTAYRIINCDYVYIDTSLPVIFGLLQPSYQIYKTKFTCEKNVGFHCMCVVWQLNFLNKQEVFFSFVHAVDVQWKNQSDPVSNLMSLGLAKSELDLIQCTMRLTKFWVWPRTRC